MGIHAGYAKFETFPIWNIPLKHPANAAYEAATADLRDVNLVDPFHLEAYGTTAINYNRDVEAFPLLNRILGKITGDKSPYASPTDMGVNRVGFGITDDHVIRRAAEQEIVRRYFRYSCEYVLGLSDRETVQKVELLMDDYGLTPESRIVVEPARRNIPQIESGIAADRAATAAALMLMDGTVITGKSSELMHAPAAVVLNAIKRLALIDDSVHLLSPATIESIRCLKRSISTYPLHLDLEEVLVALSVNAAVFKPASDGMAKLTELRGCEAHLTHIPSPGDESGLRSLGIYVTCDPLFGSRRLYNN